MIPLTEEERIIHQLRGQTLTMRAAIHTAVLDLHSKDPDRHAAAAALIKGLADAKLYEGQ